MFFPVDKSITVSAPQSVAQRIFSTSSSIEDAIAELPILALILQRNSADSPSARFGMIDVRRE
jgi:hypothetical protein